MCGVELSYCESKFDSGFATSVRASESRPPPKHAAAGLDTGLASKTKDAEFLQSLVNGCASRADRARLVAVAKRPEASQKEQAQQTANKLGEIA